MKIAAVRGWALDLIAEIDQSSPGFAGHFLRASAERRQVIAAYLSATHRAHAQCENPWDVTVAKFLEQAGHDAILSAGFGRVPEGMRNALKKAGSQPHAPRFYRYLHAVLSVPSGRSAADTIVNLRSVDLEVLRVARKLPDDVRTPMLVHLVGDLKTACDVVTIIGLLVANGIDEASLRVAIGKASSRLQLAQVWRTWTLKTVFPAHPVPASASYHPVGDAAQLRRLALRYRNCAERYISTVLDGRAAFGEFTLGAASAVVHLRYLGGQWIVEDILAAHNRTPPSDLSDAAYKYLTNHGVLGRAPPATLSGKWEPLRRQTRYHQLADQYEPYDEE